VLGIHKAGAAYLPIDADYPEDRISYMLEDSGAETVLTEETVRAMIAGYENANPVNLAENSSLAYMIYTSGSTGRPKGVMISHRAMLNFVHFIRYRWHLTEKSRIACHSNFSFDASVEDLYPALTVGGCVFIVPEKERHDIFEMRRYISENSINGGSYSTQFGQLLSSDEMLDVDYLCVGGEAMTSVPKARGPVYNAYGPTEFTVDATYFELDKERTYDNIPIGRPLANCHAFITGLHGELLPQGIKGELCLAGPQIAEGYWKQEEVTREKFVDCPYLKGQKMYRTGDLARYNGEGQLLYLGRIDTQVKLRGFRIELGEIESRASAFEGVKTAAAEVKRDNLVLYYVSENELDNDALKAFLSESLTEYMVPSVYMRLPEMPMTPNGKIDRKALPEPEIGTDEEITAPETDTEKKLFEISSEILGTDRFGITNNLVSLGLSSLDAMRLTGAIEQKLGVRLSVSVIMQKPEIRAIAAYIDSNGSIPLKTLAPYEIQETYPITENQRGIIVDCQMKPDTTQYNIPSITVFDCTDGEKLAEALRRVINAHSYIKVRFEYSGDDIVQRRNDDEEAVVTLEKLTEKPDSTFFQSRIKPFDLFKDRLYRAEIYTYGDTSWLFMDLHHTVYDGFSSIILENDLRAALEGKTVENEGFTAFDYALYERERAGSKEYEEAEKHFDELVSDAAPAGFPDSDKTDGVAEGVVIVKTDAADIDTFCRKTGVTYSTFLQAAFAETLSRITREEKVMYTTISSGRSADTSLQSCVGMFVKTLPVAGIKSSGMTTTEYVTAMHDELNATYGMDIYPYTRIVSRHRLYAEMMFVYQEGMAADISLENQEDLSLDEVKMPISVDAWKEGGNFILRFEYDGRKYGKEDITRLGNAVKNAAESLAAEEYVKDIRLVSDEEEKAILSLSKGETLDYEEKGTWVDLFKAQAERTPDKNAVTDSEGSFTYGELDRISDQIAANLIENGVKPNTFVAAKMGRSKLFTAAVLGIHKAGAAYLPIDADYPEDRISYMLEDSGAETVLTEET
ncbi:MAG: amino acid adenylation domain-containing protein, partial [Lachnospiraceae bacterium]|nr:amino acid adenylation domain-containing protein [Lachnospiraceae bacterium]